MAGLAALMVGAVLILARVLQARVPRQLPVAQRAHRLPHRRRHPGRHDPARAASSASRSPPAASSSSSSTTLQEIPDTSLATLLVSVAVWVIILGQRADQPADPGRADRGGPDDRPRAIWACCRARSPLLGAVQGGLPPLGLPQGVITVDNIVALLPTVLSCFIIILAQSAATSRAYADQVRRQLRRERRPHRALRGQPRRRACPARGSSTAARPRPRWSTAPVGKSQLAQLTAGFVVLVVLLFLTGALAYMPSAVLAAVVMLIGIKLIDIKGMQGIARVRTGEFAVALVTAATVVLVGIEQAIVLAIALSIIEHLYHSYRPYDRLLTPNKDGDYTFQEIDRRRPGRARTGHLPLRGEPLLREQQPVHRGDRRARRERRSQAALAVRERGVHRRHRLLGRRGHRVRHGRARRPGCHRGLRGRGSQGRRPARRVRADREDRQGPHLPDAARAGSRVRGTAGHDVGVACRRPRRHRPRPPRPLRRPDPRVAPTAHGDRSRPRGRLRCAYRGSGNTAEIIRT